jgi:hypothetical protein
MHYKDVNAFRSNMALITQVSNIRRFKETNQPTYEDVVQKNKYTLYLEQEIGFIVCRRKEPSNHMRLAHHLIICDLHTIEMQLMNYKWTDLWSKQHKATDFR